MVLGRTVDKVRFAGLAHLSSMMPLFAVQSEENVTEK
jgi:hypothetical protein